jgi:hypothetical protein
MGSSAGMMGSGCSEGWPTGPAALNTEARRQPPPDDWRSHLRATGSGSRAHQRLLPAVHQRAHLLGSEGRHARLPGPSSRWRTCCLVGASAAQPGASKLAFRKTCFQSKRAFAKPSLCPRAPCAAHAHRAACTAHGRARSPVL